MSLDRLLRYRRRCCKILWHWLPQRLYLINNRSRLPSLRKRHNRSLLPVRTVGARCSTFSFKCFSPCFLFWGCRFRQPPFLSGKQSETDVRIDGTVRFCDGSCDVAVATDGTFDESPSSIAKRDGELSGFFFTCQFGQKFHQIGGFKIAKIFVVDGTIRIVRDV